MAHALQSAMQEGIRICQHIIRSLSMPRGALATTQRLFACAPDGDLRSHGFAGQKTEGEV